MRGLGQGAKAKIASISSGILDFLLPHRCVHCGVTTDRAAGLCATCWSGLSFITRPYCGRCGLPFEFNIPGTTLCASCLRKPPAYDKAFSPLRYEEMSRSLLLSFKHGDRVEHGRYLAHLLQPHIATFGFENPLFTPVPLHHWRVVKRQYNQAAILVQALQNLGGYEVDLLALRRRRPTPSQQGLNAKQRKKNVAGAFEIHKRADVKGRDVILVDDVYTTGATAEACTRVLRKAGAARVGVITVARVVGPKAANI